MGKITFSPLNAEEFISKHIQHIPDMLRSTEMQGVLDLLSISSSKPTEHVWRSMFSQSFGSNPGAPEAALGLQQKWMET